jgi:hypothetical protein
MGLCDCGCGNSAKKDNQFIAGHNFRVLPLEKRLMARKKAVVGIKKSWLDPIVREKRIKGIKLNKNSPEGRESNRRAAKISAAKTRGIKRNPEIGKKISKIIKKLWQDKEYYEKMLNIRKIQWTPEVRAKMSRSATIRMNRPDEKLKNSDRMRKRFENPKFRLNHSLKISKAISAGRCGWHKCKRGYFLRNDGSVIYLASSYEFRIAVVLDCLDYVWEKCRDRIVFKDTEENWRVYTPDFKVFIHENQFVYLEAKGFVDLITFNRFNNIILHSNAPIYLLFEKDIKQLELIEDTEVIDFSKFQTIEDFVNSNYEKFWSYK